MQINKDWLSFVGVCLMFAAMVYGIMLIIQSEIREYKRAGLPATATVVSKNSYRQTGSNGGAEYLLSVTYFTQPPESEQETSVDLETGEVEFAPIELGSYESARAEVGPQTYDQINEGDKVEILYLPHRLNDVKLTDSVYNFNSIPIQTMLSIFLLGALYCLIRAFLPVKAG